MLMVKHTTAVQEEEEEEAEQKTHHCFAQGTYIYIQVVSSYSDSHHSHTQTCYVCFFFRRVVVVPLFSVV